MKRETIEQTARQLADEVGAVNITRVDLCARLGIPPTSFQHYAGASFVDFMAALDLPEGDVVTRNRIAAETRRRLILAAAVRIAERDGYSTFTRGSVASEADVSEGLVGKYFEMSQLRRAVMREAVERSILSVIAQGLANGDKIARGAPIKLKRRALRSLT